MFSKTCSLILLFLFTTVTSFGQSESILQSGRELLEEGAYQLALQQFELAGDVDKGSMKARIGQGVCYFYLEKYPEAIDLLGGLYQEGRFPWAEYYAGLTLFKMHQYDSSLFHLELSLDSDTVDLEILYYMGVIHYELSQPEEAIAVLTSFVGDTVKHGQAWYYLAESYLQIDSLQTAHLAADSAIAANPHIPKFWRVKGDIYYQEEQDASAVLAYTEAIIRNPVYRRARLNRAMAYMNLKYFRLALFDLKKLEDGLRENEQVLEAVMDCYFGLQEYESFFEASDQLLQAFPERLDILYKQGMAWYDLGKYEDALDHFSLMSDAYPNDADVAYQMGNCYYAQEDFEKAKQYFSAAALRGHARAQYNMAVTYYSLGKHDKACELWNLQAASDHEFKKLAQDSLERFCGE